MTGPTPAWIAEWVDGKLEVSVFWNLESLNALADELAENPGLIENTLLEKFSKEEVLHGLLNVVGLLVHEVNKTAEFYRNYDVWMDKVKRSYGEEFDVKSLGAMDVKRRLDDIMQDAGVGLDDERAVLQSYWSSKGVDVPGDLRVVPFYRSDLDGVDWPGTVQFVLRHGSGTDTKDVFWMKDPMRVDKGALPVPVSGER